MVGWWYFWFIFVSITRKNYYYCTDYKRNPGWILRNRRHRSRCKLSRKRHHPQQTKTERQGSNDQAAPAARQVSAGSNFFATAERHPKQIFWSQQWCKVQDQPRHFLHLEQCDRCSAERTEFALQQDLDHQRRSGSISRSHSYPCARSKGKIGVARQQFARQCCRHRCGQCGLLQ